MLVIRVELLFGTVRAGSADDIALTGDQPSGEWPLSPARLFAALVAGGGTESGVPADVGLAGLDLLTLTPPLIYASAGPEVCSTPLRPRFVPIDENAKQGAVQDYPARVAQRVSPGVRLAPQTAELIYVWSEVDPTAAELAALRYRAARIPYLGCADSPAIVRVDTVMPPTTLPVWKPDTGGTVALPVPDDGLLARLDDHYRRWRSGEPVRRAWVPTRILRYLDPGHQRRKGALPVAGRSLWLRFARPISGRWIVSVAETLRAAVLEHVTRRVGDESAVPDYLHGHLGQRGSGCHSARWVPLPTVGVPHADGRIRGAFVWLPPAATADEALTVQQAMREIHQLVAPGKFGTGVMMFDGTRWPWSSNPRRWTGPATRWISATPVVHERHTGGQLHLEEVQRWCDHAGLPSPCAHRESPTPLLEGTPNWSPFELSRDGRWRGPRSYVEIEFDQPVAGPVVLGRGRGFGLGLCAPAHQGR